MARGKTKQTPSLVSQNGQEEIIPIPNLVQLQIDSYRWFLEEGLRELFRSFSPIEDFTGTLSLEFLDHTLGEPKYPPQECRERDVTYEAPLRVRVMLVNKEKRGEHQETEVYLGELPLMTERGTFIINGAERVVVSQIARSPGVYFRDTVDLSGKTLYSAQTIPSDGAWVELDIGSNDVISVRIGQTKKFPVTLLLRTFHFFEEAEAQSLAEEITERTVDNLLNRRLVDRVVDMITGEVLGEPNAIIDEALAQRIVEAEQVSPIRVRAGSEPCATREDILRLFGEEEIITEVTPANLAGKRSLLEIRLPGEAAPVVQEYEWISPSLAERLADLGLSEFKVLAVDETIEATLREDPVQEAGKSLGELEKEVLETFYRLLRPGDQPTVESARSLLRSLFFDPRRYDLGRVGRYKMNKKLGLDVPLKVRTLTKHDLIAIIRYLLKLRQDVEGYHVDDIDHLENKRVRAVGELLQNQLRLGFLRMERVARERMTSLDPEEATPQHIISIKPITAAIRSFFGSGALSQFMDQTNPLAELCHKRRLSAMGPGGLSRQSAKLEVRDVHRSHYGRICPIMTPEGPNIGLINSLALFAKVDEFGFLATPYRKVVNGVATDEVVYLTADQEREYAIAPANVPTDQKGKLLPERIICRQGDTFPQLTPEEIDFMDVSPKQVFSAATCLIPFLENDDANRALMGSNMQRQAVPLVRTDAPLVKTGVEHKVAVDSGAVVTAGRDGVVTEVDARHITIRGYDHTEENPSEETHELLSFARTNQATCTNQKPLVRKGEHVRQGQVIADGACTQGGELALGRNLLVAFLPWEGYNYEDAVIISERVVREDWLTSIHIDKYEIQARETKLGPEEITADIPNVGEDLLRNLDERGIIRIGVEVGPEDILVGKVAPKGQAEMTAEEKLVIAIFGKKAEEMRDNSLRVPHGAKGKVVGVRVFSRYKFACQACGARYEFARSGDMSVCERCGSTEVVREQGDELPPGVNQMVRVYVAQRRKITEGDKLAGRHGNKGVIAKILPEEDMPYLPDGRPVDIVLNPLGVPSRMNIGQILETHLGLVAKWTTEALQEGAAIEQFIPPTSRLAQHADYEKLKREGRLSFRSPVFESAPEEEIFAGLKRVTEYRQDSLLRDYLRTEVPVWADDVPENSTTGELLAALKERLLALDQETLDAQAEHFAIVVETWESAANREEQVELLLETIKQNALRRLGFNPETGKTILYDGRTGEPFDREVCVGEIYMLKLHHLVEDKIHARSTGPYSLVTQQPLGGKAQFGGQRFGEMEVWALEAYGAAHSLQEMLTIKSDDVLGRVKTYENIVKGENLLEPGVPESFKILIKELQSLGLEVMVKSKEGETVELREMEEER